MARAVLTTALVLAGITPATAYQTEVDPGTMEWKREGLARWHQEQDREEIREERETTEAASAVAVPDVPTPTAGCLSGAEVAAYARGAGFTEAVIPTMVSIAYRESHYCPGAVNSSSGACGLWQMYPCPGPEALNPATNAAMAYAKYAASGLAPWGY